MPAVQPNGKVLVTGANGYAALWIVRDLLENGYSVRGTVRSLQRSGPFIKEYFKSYGDRIEVVEVADFNKEGAFDDVVHDVDAIVHVANPSTLDIEDPKDFIDPAVNGTVGLLTSAAKNAPKLKRFVYISSATTLISYPFASLEPTVFNEENWNVKDVEETERLGKAAPPMVKYGASKYLAEKAAWNFHEKNKETITWDITAIIPTLIVGPPIREVASPSKLNTSLMWWWSSVVEPGPKSEDEALATDGFIDVRDLGSAITASIQKEAAGGERIIISGGSFMWQDFINAARSLKPSPLPNRQFALGFPDAKRRYNLTFDASKSERILGVKYRTLEEVTRGILEDAARRGW